jgi:DNA-binding CsgD family transcriptional regulator
MLARAELISDHGGDAFGNRASHPCREASNSWRPVDLSDCRSPADLCVWLEQFARSFGFYGARYMHIGHLPVGGERNEHERPARFLSTASRECKASEAGACLHGDPSVTRAQNSFEPFTWSTRIGDDLVERHRAWLNSERARGVGAGIVIPVQDYVAGPAHVSLFGVDEAGAARLLNEHAPELAFAAARFHAIAKNLLPAVEGASIGSALTQREIQILRLAALGWTVSSSAAALGVSSRTIEFHLSNICEKLRAVSKTHAVAIATTKQLIAI